MEYSFSDLLTLLGSLGLFLYGMKVMSDSLQQLAGSSMRTFLASATSNRFFALLTGFVITATIQSSSATTLMVVSFTNAGLLTLTEAIGVIMGANIGTTVTAWLITILGFKVSMSSIALPLVGVGFVLLLSKQLRTSQWGQFIIGFALLFIGLQFLKEAVPDIGQHPETLAWLNDYTQLGFASVLLFVFIGTVLTLVLQSSSATMAITLLMCFEGWLPFEVAAAMVLGENIGTTITANIAAIVSNAQAKRAALAHLIFNLLGVCWMLALYYPFINLIASLVENIEGSSPFVTTAAIPVALSLFHTGFNIINSSLLIGFVNIIAGAVSRLVSDDAPEAPQIDQPVYLSETSMQYVETGVKALTDESLRLLDNAGYRIISHALGIHRADLEREGKLSALLNREHELLDIDVEALYTKHIKTVYGHILAYATRLQNRLNPDASQIESIRNILVADRLLVQTIKLLPPIKENLDIYMRSDNETMRHEYNVMRRRILKIIRNIRRLRTSDDQPLYFERVQHQRKKLDSLDLLSSGRLDNLIASGSITEDMAGSLLNDSGGATQIARNLIDITTLLLKPTDTVADLVNTEVPPTTEEVTEAIIANEEKQDIVDQEKADGGSGS